MLTPFLQGLGTGGGLIAAIGAQNAFVLSQGVRKNHHVVIALICIVCDAVFITAGVGGLGAAVSVNPHLSRLMAWGGAGFLFFHGLRALRSAVRGAGMAVDDQALLTLKTAVLATLAVTLLNPHFYLDTVILLGSVSSQFAGEGRIYFWVGALSASTIWFIALSLGGQLLAPLFSKPVSWRILDSMVWVTMWTIAAMLVFDSLSG
ncbi:MAG: LysE/ArgO family amino acid transporter [Desulfopila sp.]